VMWTGVFLCGLIATGVIALSREPGIEPALAGNAVPSGN
jgi:hypothetical protein